MKFSGVNFQLQGTTDLWAPSITSMPPFLRPKRASRYHAISPKYSGEDGADSSNVAKNNPQ